MASRARCRRAPRERRRYRGLVGAGIALGALGAAVVATLAGCERSEPGHTAAPPPGQRVAVPAQRPAYSFAAGLAEREPEIAGFLRHLLETCLVGDYEGYRMLVARSVEPDSRARFEKTLGALKSVVIENIEAVHSDRLPEPCYRVLARAEFHPEAQARRARGRAVRNFALLVVREEGQWRAALAPAELQPEDEVPESATGEEPSSGPSYPWDQEGSP